MSGRFDATTSALSRAASVSTSTSSAVAIPYAFHEREYALNAVRYELVTRPRFWTAHRCHKL